MPETSSNPPIADWETWRAWSSRWWALWQPPAGASAGGALSPALSPFAPQSLVQPILPGAMFGNVISITERNSASPETERDIATEVSYGRQLGKVIDALAALIADRPGGAGTHEALGDLLALRAKIERTKQASMERRVERLESDLLWLKEKQPEQFKRIAALLATSNPVKDRK